MQCKGVIDSNLKNPDQNFKFIHVNFIISTDKIETKNKFATMKTFTSDSMNVTSSINAKHVLTFAGQKVQNFFLYKKNEEQLLLQ